MAGLIKNEDIQLVREGRDLEAEFASDYVAAPDDAARRRVVIDQVASLTDGSARAWATRIGAWPG